MQFAFPLFFAAAAALPLLVLAYLRRAPRNRKLVSSLFLLKHLPRRPSLRRRIELPWRFFVELLALLLLLLAGTWPLITDRSTSIAILLDTSMSMRAVDSSGRSRFDLAREKLADWIDQHGRNSRFAVFTSPSSSAINGNELVSASEAKAILGSAAPTLSEGDLSQALGEISKKNEFTGIAVATDQQPLEATAGGSPTRVETLSVGELRPNIFLTDAQIDRTGAPARAVLKVVAGLSGAPQLSAKIRVTGLSTLPPPSQGTVPTAVVAEAPITLRSGGDTPISLPLEGDNSALYSIKLLRDPAAAGNETNAISEDDEGWLLARHSGGQETALVTPAEDEKNDMLGLSSLRFLSVSKFSPEQFAALTGEQKSSYSSILFHRSAPASLPESPALLILPPADNTIFPIAEESAEARVSSWAADHPITTYLRLNLLDIPAATLFAPQEWTQAVVSSERGTLVIAGEKGGARYAGVGFELLPFEGKKNPALSTLTLNLLSWLRSGADLSHSSVTGEKVELERGYTWTVSAPDGTVEELQDSVVLQQAGLYQLKGTRTSGAGQEAKESERYIAVSPFHPGESRTYARRSFAFPERSGDTEPQMPRARTLWNEFLMAAAVLIISDLMLVLLLHDGSKLSKRYC